MSKTFDNIRKSHPILVTGSHRSGTTWVGKMLNEETETTYIFEPFNIENSEPCHSYPLQFWFTYLAGLDQESRDQCLSALVQSLTYKYQPPLADNYVWHYAGRVKLRRSWANFQKRSQHLRPLVKDPIALFSAPLLSQAFGMQVVCMIRHPLAFVSSIKKWQWTFPFDHFLNQPKLIEELFPEEKEQIEKFAATEFDYVKQATFLWILFHKVIKQYQQDHPTWIFKRHEDLVLDPLTEYKHLYEVLNLSYTDQVQAKISAFTDLSNKNVTEHDTQSPSFKKRNSTQILYAWQKRLEPDEINYVLEQTGDLKKEFYPDPRLVDEYQTT